MAGIDEIPLIEISDFNEILEQLKKCLNQLDKPELEEKFCALIFHCNELNCVTQKFIHPILEEYIQNRSIINKLPEELSQDLCFWRSNDYTFSWELSVQLKLYFFVSRRCFDLIIEILGELFFILGPNKGERRPSNTFSKFVDFILAGEHLKYEKNISELLNDYIIDITILRFLRNTLKQDNYLTFDIEYSSNFYHIYALLEFSELDDTLKKMESEGKIIIKDHHLILEIKPFIDRIFKLIVVLNAEIIKTIFANVKLENS